MGARDGHRLLVLFLLALIMGCTQAAPEDRDETVEETAVASAPEIPAITSGPMYTEEPGQWDLSEVRIGDSRRTEVTAALEESWRDLPGDPGDSELPEALFEDQKRLRALIEPLDDDPEQDEVLSLLNVGPVDVQVGVVCILDLEQIPCSDEADQFEVRVPAWSARQYDLAFEDLPDDGVAFALLPVKDDLLAGLYSSSRAAGMHDPNSPDPAERMPPQDMDDYEIEPAIPGCGMVLFDDSGPDVDIGNAPTTRIDRDADLAGILEPCEGFDAPWSAALLIKNRAEVVDLDWSGRPFEWDTTLRLPVPPELVQDEQVTSLQLVHLLWEDGWWSIENAPEVQIR